MSEFHNLDSLNLDEFEEPAEMENVFCTQMTEEEYEEQASTETEKALKELMAYIEKNPESYNKVLQKRKREQVEGSGFMSYLKVNIVSMFNGGVYPGTTLSKDELDGKVSELKTGMKTVFEYSKETKGLRTSKRVAERRARVKREENENRSTCPAPRPLPASSLDISPANLPNLTRPPLRDINSQTSKPVQHEGSQPIKTHVCRVLRSNRSKISMSSLSSLNSELNSCNPMKRQRTTGFNKSPGGTPVSHRKMSRKSSGSNNSPRNFDTCIRASLLNTLEHKFRHVCSPSPVGRFNNAISPVSALNSQVEFTP